MSYQYLPTTKSEIETQRRAPRRFPILIMIGVGIMCIGSLVLLSTGFLSRKKQSAPSSNLHGDEVETGGIDMQSSSSPSSTELHEDEVEGVAFYQCSGGGDTAIDLIMLHGATFTKENWKKKGILENLCKISNLSVIAMDLSTRAGYTELQSILDALREKGLISQSRAVALVTPSASGYSMVDWIENDLDGLLSYVGYWVPVASPAIKYADEGKLQAVQNRLPILAIYGSRDSGGKKVSERLQSLAGATIVEIDGGHPCYLDSPGDFMSNVTSFLPL